MNSDVLRWSDNSFSFTGFASVTNRIFYVGEFWYGAKAVLPKQVPI